MGRLLFDAGRSRPAYQVGRRGTQSLSPETTLHMATKKPTPAAKKPVAKKAKDLQPKKNPKGGLIGLLKTQPPKTDLLPAV